MNRSRCIERIDGGSRSSLGKKWSCGKRALTSRGIFRISKPAAVPPTAGGSAGGGGGGSVRRVTNRDLDALRKVFGPQRPVDGSSRQEGGPAGGSSSGSSGSSRPGEQPLFPMGLPSDPAISAAISAAASWRELRDLYSATARRIDPGQLLAITQRLAHVTGALWWPDGAPLPEPAAPGGAPWAPPLSEQEAEEVVALARSLCPAIQVCLQDMYGMQNVAGLLQALVSLGVPPPTSWLRSAELVALRTQQEGGQAASSLVNELLSIASSFQRVGHVPESSFIALLGEVRPLEEIRRPQGSGAGEQEEQDAPMLLVLSSPQLLCLARAVLLWGLQPPAGWPEAFLQAAYTRISRANKLGGAGPGLSGDEAMEAAEAEGALGVGGLAALLWAAVMMEARPADPGGQWMAELMAAALRRLREVLAAEAAGGGSSAAGAGSALPGAVGTSLQDMVGLVSALQQMMYDPGQEWVSTCLQAAAITQARTDPSAAAAASGDSLPGDALSALLFLAAQYDHPQDEETRGSVVGMAQAAQDWMRLQAAAAAAGGGGDGGGYPRSAPAALFSSRGLTQLLMALVRMGGRPSEEWVAAWTAAAEPLARGGGGGTFDADQVIAVMATAAEAEVQLSEELQLDMVAGLLMPAPASPTQGSAVTQAGVSGPGAFLPSAAVAAAAVPGPSGASGTSVPSGPPSGASPGGDVAIRSLPQFRQLLDIVELQPHQLRPGWLEPFVALVEDFRLRLSSRELLGVLRVLGYFRDTLLMDTAAVMQGPAASSQGGPAALAASRRQGSTAGPTVLRPSAPPSPPSPSASPAGSETDNDSPALLDSTWVRGLLDDLRARGGLRGPRDLMQLAQALSSLSAPPALLSYVEVFAVALTGDDGRRKAQLPTGPAARATAAAAAPSASATTAAAAAAAAAAAGGGPGAAQPSAARIRLRLQREAAERRGTDAGAATAAAAASAPASALSAAVEDHDQDEDEAQEWGLAWPAMLGAFAAGGHVPERRWWDRFAAATSPVLESYEPPRLAATAAAALGLSSQHATSEAAARAGGREGAAGGSQEAHLALLPNLEWHQQAFSHVADAIRSCPISMDEVRDQAVEELSEQRRQQQQQLQQDATTSTSSTGAEGAEADAEGAQFSSDEFRDACMAVSSQLPALLLQLTQPRVPLPPQLLGVMEDLGTDAAAGAQRAMEEAEAVGGAVGRPAGAGRGEEEDLAAAGGEVDFDSIVYAQQIMTLVMQSFLASDFQPSESWMQRVAAVMLFSRPVWGAGSETGELLEQQHLLLAPDQLTTLSYLAGRFGLPLQPQQVRLLLQHAARQSASGELAAGELAAALSGLSGLSGVDVLEEGEEELTELLEALSSQASQLSPQGLAESAGALLQLGVGLQPELAARFRQPLVRNAAELTPRQALAVLAAGSSMGLEPPTRELLAALSVQVGRLAAHPDPLGPSAATEVAYEVLRWFPEVAPAESDSYISRLKAGLQGLVRRLDEVSPAAASKLALLLSTAGVSPEGRTPQEQQAALQPLVAASLEGLAEYDNEQLSNAIMGLSLLRVQLPRAWLEQFTEASRLLLPEADARSLSYILSGLADQQASLEPPYAAALWSEVRRQAAPPLRAFDLLAARTLLEAAGQLGLRPDRELMQAVLDCALMRYREAPDPAGLAELVQVMASFSYVPTPGWAAEARSALSASMGSLPREAQAAVAGFLKTAIPRGL